MEHTFGIRQFNKTRVTKLSNCFTNSFYSPDLFLRVLYCIGVLEIDGLIPSLRTIQELEFPLASHSRNNSDQSKKCRELAFARGFVCLTVGNYPTVGK